LWLAACAGASQGAGSSSAAASGDLPRADNPQAEDQSCWRDTECVLVDDCCGCARGGLRMSVRKDKLEALTENSASACEQRTCSEQASQHRSCTATAARCAGGRCVPKI
jgi:hypothetical protein